MDFSELGDSLSKKEMAALAAEIAEAAKLAAAAKEWTKE